MRRNLQPSDLGDLLSQARVAILATRSADGTTLQAPVWHEYSQGAFTFVTFSGDVKLRHIRRDPNVNLIVAENEPPYRGIEVRGQAQIISENGGSILRRLAERYLKNRDVDAYIDKIDAWMAEAGHGAIFALRVEPEFVRAWDYADEDW